MIPLSRRLTADARRFTTGLALVCSLWLGCSSGPSGPPRPLEIGTRAMDDSFAPMVAAASVPILLGANGLNMIVPSLRAADIDPRAPDASVEVEIGGILMAADIKGVRADMTADGPGYVLWDLRVPFQTELCCYNCAPAIVSARIEDASGQIYEGRVTVQLERGGCPDLTACCQSANECPDPSLAQVCE